MKRLRTLWSKQPAEVQEALAASWAGYELIARRAIAETP